MQIQIFLLTFPVCVPNTGDNDVMYLTRIKLSSKTEKETECLELIVLVNRCNIYVYINNKVVILLLMAIYNKNQATQGCPWVTKIFSQNFSQGEIILAILRPS